MVGQSNHTLKMKSVCLLVVAVWLLTACGPSANPLPTAVTGPGGAATATQPSTSSNTPAATQVSKGPAPTLKNPDTLIYATTSDAISLDPAWAYDTSSSLIVAQVYETLIFPKQDKADEYVPMLASKWEVSQDGKTYTFTIRKGVKFQQGQDLTPEDVAYSFWRGFMQDRAGGPQWILLQPFFGLSVNTFKDDVVGKQYSNDWVAACQAAKQAVTFDNNAGTVTMNLKQAYGPMLQVLSVPGSWASIVSKSWTAAQGDWNGDCATAEKFHDPKAEDDKLTKVMNGTGPFKLDRWAPGEEIDLSRNDNYWLKESLWEGRPSGPAKIGRVVVKVVPEWGTRFAMLKTGDADIVDVPRPNITEVDPLIKETCPFGKVCTQTNPNGFVRVYTAIPEPAANAMFFNQQVNVSGGNTKVGSGQLDGNGVPPDFFSDVHVRKAFNYCFDWDTYIKQVLQGEATQAHGPFITGELGYKADQPHYSFDPGKCADEFKAAGLKSASGASLWDTGFRVQYIYPTGIDAARSAGQVLKQNLAKVNPKFKLDVINEDWPAINKDSDDGRMTMWQEGWVQDFNDSHDWALPYLGSGGAFSSFENFPKDLQSQLDQLILKGAQTTDQAARAKIYEQLQTMAYENALDLFLTQTQGRHYEQSWLKGWYYSPVYAGIDYYYSMSKGQ